MRGIVGYGQSIMPTPLVVFSSSETKNAFFLKLCHFSLMLLHWYSNFTWILSLGVTFILLMSLTCGCAVTSSLLGDSTSMRDNHVTHTLRFWSNFPQMFLLIRNKSEQNFFTKISAFEIWVFLGPFFQKSIILNFLYKANLHENLHLCTFLGGNPKITLKIGLEY